MAYSSTTDAALANNDIPPQSLLPIRTISRTGQPPARRISHPGDAQALAEQLWMAAGPRVFRSAAYQGQVNGNPPYNPSEMRRQGRASDPNYNTLEAKAIWSMAMVPYYDLFSGADHYVKVTLKEDEVPDPRSRGRWEQIISLEYDRMLKRWPGWGVTFQRMLGDFVLHGKGFMQWENSTSWRMRKLDHQMVLVPDGTPIDYDTELDVVVVLADYPVVSLWSKVRDRESAEAMGWDYDETVEAIRLAMPVDPTTGSPPDAVAVQQMIRDADLTISARSSMVRTANLYVREFSGKWSHLIVRRSGSSTGGVTASTQSAPGYIYEAHAKYDDLLDCMVPFFYEAGAGSWNGATGLGRDIFTATQVKDRLACSRDQTAMIRGSLVLQPKSALGKERMQAVQVGAITWLPANVDVLQGTIWGDLEGNIAASRELDTTLSRNTGIYRPQAVDKAGGGNPQTLGEFEAKFAQASALSSGAVDRFYSQLDRFYAVQARRVFKFPSGDDPAAKEARRFKECCVGQGVPEEVLDPDMIESVVAWRTIGSGSFSQRQQTLLGLMQTVYGQLKPGGQEALLRDVITSLATASQTSRYMPQAEWDGVPNDQQWAATVENADLRGNMPARWTASQNNIIHAQTHLEAASQAAASLQQGADLAQVFGFLEAVGAHVLVHLQAESANPVTKVAQAALTKQCHQLAQLTNELQRKLTQQQQAMVQQQQATQQVMTDEQIAQFEAQSKAAISAMKARQLIALKSERQQADVTLKAQRQQADIALKAQKQQADTALAAQAQGADTALEAQRLGIELQLADAETAAGIHRDNAKAVAEVRRKGATSQEPGE